MQPHRVVKAASGGAPTTGQRVFTRYILAMVSVEELTFYV